MVKFFSKAGTELGSKTWWKAASVRAVRTVISVIIPFLLAGTVVDVDWALIGSTTLLAAIVSYLTSLAGLKEVGGVGEPKTLALAIRGVKTFAQTLVSFIGTSLVFQDVNWSNILVISLSATVVTLLQGVLTSLPEEEKIVDAPTVDVVEDESLSN